MLYRLETGKTTGGDLNFCFIKVPVDDLLTDTQVTFRQNQDHLHIIICLQKSIDAVKQDRLAFQEHELFRKMGSHPGSCSPGNDDGVFFHFANAKERSVTAISVVADEVLNLFYFD